MKKRYRAVAVAVAAGVMLMAQPVQAAGAMVLYTSPVLMAGGENAPGAEIPGGNAVFGAPSDAPGQPGPVQGPGAGQMPGESQISGGGQSADGQIPGGGQAAGDQARGTDQAAGSQAPPGDQGAVLSPVIMAGGNEQAADQQAGSDQQVAADEQAAQAASRQSGGRQIDPTRPMVALTFDDGPQPSVGNRIMDCLAQYDGRATFFMVGDRVASRTAEVQRMVAEGHEVANHTMNHKYLQKLGAAEIQSQVTKCNDAIEAACGVRPKIMRLPGGNYNATVLANTHMPMIQWNIDTLDWKTRNAQKTVDAVLNHVQDGDIILMHELYSQSGDAALKIIPELTNRGYQLVTVSEMAAAKGQPLQAGKLYSQMR